jgi:hypothetical protein
MALAVRVVVMSALRTADKPPAKGSVEDPPIVQPPSTLVVTHETKVLLWTAGGQPLTRKAGF